MGLPLAMATHFPCAYRALRTYLATPPVPCTSLLTMHLPCTDRARTVHLPCTSDHECTYRVHYHDALATCLRMPCQCMHLPCARPCTFNINNTNNNNFNYESLARCSPRCGCHALVYMHLLLYYCHALTLNHVLDNGAGSDQFNGMIPCSMHPPCAYHALTIAGHVSSASPSVTPHMTQVASRRPTRVTTLCSC